MSGNIQLEMVYFGGKRVAHRTSSNVIDYYEGDLLGSARTMVQAGQTSPCYDADFPPFGDVSESGMKACESGQG